jgi:hypothetical protein
MTSLLLEVDIRSYWCAGTGRAGGEDVDALIDRDENGLPVLRGRHIKGLLREAAERLKSWHADGWDGVRINLLFGRRPLSPQISAPACVRFGDARLPSVIAAKVRREPQLANEFVRRLASTRIDYYSGVAEEKTLRSTEAAVPLKLQSRLTWDPSARLAIKPIGGEEGSDAIGALKGVWIGAIEECLPYVLAVGAHRSRGYGRAVLSKSNEGS